MTLTDVLRKLHITYIETKNFQLCRFPFPSLYDCISEKWFPFQIIHPFIQVNMHQMYFQALPQNETIY